MSQICIFDNEKKMFQFARFARSFFMFPFYSRNSSYQPLEMTYFSVVWTTEALDGKVSGILISKGLKEIKVVDNENTFYILWWRFRFCLRCHFSSSLMASECISMKNTSSGRALYQIQYAKEKEIERKVALFIFVCCRKCLSWLKAITR